MRVFLVVLTFFGVVSCGETPSETSRAIDSVTEFQGRDIGCLKEAIYFEAGNVPPAAREAVAHVIMNRVNDSRFPGSVCEVISEGEKKGRCQFSYRCDLDPSVVRWPEQMAKANETAQKVLNGKSADPTRGALFFHAKWMAPGWFSTRKRVGQFGGNVFYL